MAQLFGIGVDSTNTLASSATTVIGVTTAGSDTPTATRPGRLFGGDYSASPFLTLQSAINSISKNRQHRAVVTLGTGTFVGAQLAAFSGGIGIDPLNTGVDLLVKDALVIKATQTLATLTTGDNSGTAGPGTSTQVIQKPTISANYTASNLAGRFFVIVSGGGASTDSDIPNIFPIISNTTTSFTLSRPAPGVDSTTVFQITNSGSTLTSRSPGQSLACLDIVGCDTPIRIVGVKFDDATNAFWASLVRLSRKVTFYACDITAAIDTGISAAMSGWVELDNCIIRHAGSGGFVVTDSDKVLTRGLYSLGGLVSTRDCRHVKVQGWFDGCAGGAINIQDSQYAVLDADISNSTVTIPVDLRNVTQGFFTSLSGTNAGLAGQVAVNFGGSGQFYVSGTTITTAHASNYTIESTSGNTWATLASYYKTDRRGNTVVTSDFTQESVQGQFNINGVFNALQDANFGGKAIYYGLVYYPILVSQTAYASGGQASALECGYNTTQVTTAAESRASVKYRANLDIAGCEQLVFNDSTNIVNLYPPSGGFINSLAVNTPIQVPPKSMVIGRTLTGGATIRALRLAETFDPANKFELYFDFVNSLSSCFTSFTLNSGTVAAIPSETQSPGIIQMATVAATGTGLIYGNTSYLVDTGPFTAKFRARVSAAATGGQDYDAYIGVTSQVDQTGPGVGAYFYHSSADSSWIARTKQAGTTSTDTAIAVPAATFQTFQIEFDADCTSVQFFIDGTLVATHTANIPTAVVAPSFGITKTAGSTSITLDVDYVRLEQFIAR